MRSEYGQTPYVAVVQQVAQRGTTSTRRVDMLPPTRSSLLAHVRPFNISVSIVSFYSCIASFCLRRQTSAYWKPNVVNEPRSTPSIFAFIGDQVDFRSKFFSQTKSYRLHVVEGVGWLRAESFIVHLPTDLTLGSRVSSGL